MLIKSHQELADAIAGKKIMHLNSLGKDSVISLEWLVKNAQVEKIVSVFFDFIGFHPDDDRYWKYLKKRFPNVEFIREPNCLELSHIAAGRLQDPYHLMCELNHWEFISFDFAKHVQDIKKKFDCDYVSYGNARYESVTRASGFHKRGIIQGDKIYPLGMMSKKAVYTAIEKSGIKLHPCYNLIPSTLDLPSYYRMRSTFITNPDYKKRMYKLFPMLALDEYRYEVLLK